MASPLDQLRQLEETAEQALAQAATAAEIELVRVQFLGRKGPIAEIMRSLGAIDPALRPQVGQAANALKTRLEAAIAARNAGAAAPAAAAVDVTLPGYPYRTGRPHPITRIMQTIVQQFVQLGFRVAEGPEAETEYHNFDALNIPAQHPSRDAFDTFYLDLPPDPRHGRWLLRSHTSPVQVRVMRQFKPPLAIVVPGQVFRPDAVDASHSFVFHQIEGLLVDRDVTFAQLKGLLELFIRDFFGPTTQSRFRPHYFPFTEPSAEVDIACSACSGRGCSTCGRKGWLEILGCGLVHPNVFKAVGYDPARWSGLAFGLGVERLIMLKYGIDDIRQFYDNDLRFLEQC